MQRLKIRKGDDLHVHFRSGDVLRLVLPFTVGQFGRALVMPNTRPKPILCAADACEYKAEILHEVNSMGSLFQTATLFEPLMTIQVNADTTPEIVREARKVGVVAGKIYPEGVTTNSDNGVRDYKQLFPVFAEMEKVGLALSLHGEMPDHDIPGLEKEVRFLEVLERIAPAFPDLRIVLEHITTLQAVECVESLSVNVAATITVHHLYLTLDHVIGYHRSTKGLMQPHNFCKPVAKEESDRIILLSAATSGNPKFFYGGDSAPHPRGGKECADVCAGVFNAPVALPLLAEKFDEEGKLKRLENFVSRFGAEFYGLPLNQESVELTEEEWEVPRCYAGVVPFLAGQKLSWKVI